MARRRLKKAKLLTEIKDNDRTSTRQRDEQDSCSELPTEILEVIISQLSFKDNIRVSAVCRRWLAVCKAVRKLNKTPWLMCFTESKDIYLFYDPYNRKFHSLELPELRLSKPCYTKDGWLLMHNTIERDMFFFSPYTQEKFDLPKRGPQNQDQIIAFSTAPTSPNCVVFNINAFVSPTTVAISTYCPGDTEWTTVLYHSSSHFFTKIWTKVVFFNGLFYCMDINGSLGVYDHDARTWTILPISSVASVIHPDVFGVKYWWKARFLAECNGDLYFVYSRSDYTPSICKLNQINQVWEEVETLEGSTLFVSYLSSQGRIDLYGPMRNNIFFPKVRFYGKRCVSYSLDSRRYFPINRSYNWGEQNVHDYIWIDAPEDMSAFH